MKKLRLFFMPKKGDQQGFSMVELLIALPLISIIMVTLLGSLFTQYTEILGESARSDLRVTGQRLLINLQDELLFTIAYGDQLDTNIADTYAPSGGWTYNTSPATLIINEVALDSTRRDDDRHIVRRRLSPCESSAVTANPVALNNVIYFVNQAPDEAYGTLYRRTLTPTHGTCSIDSTTGNPCTPTTTNCRDIAKETTCPTINVGTGTCTSSDSVLTENVIDMQLTYFSEDNVETPYPPAADKIEVSLTLGDKVYGQDVSVEVKHTIRKIN
jgi:prepilin-type N-terminal cleavage/methylation domain-containing protein